ncbi:MAG: hypothetical protein JOS17DRAFT_793984 [Linnemannia elongata]|nr:MAG: hypothetical protein JOS17DRAFT_793984 [Linnemannia elongata]
MLSYLKHKFYRQPTITTTTTPSTPTSTKLSPLDIPLILDLIFSHLSDVTIRNAVVRVCRQWHSLNHNRLRRTITYYDFRSSPLRKKQILARLPGAYRLECVLEKRWFDPVEVIDVRKVIDEEEESGIRGILRNQLLLVQEGEEEKEEEEEELSLKEVTTAGQGEETIRNVNERELHLWRKTQSTATTTRLATFYKHCPLRELSLQVHSPFEHTMANFPYPATLTCLELDMASLSIDPLACLSLTHILQTCSLLETLSIKARVSTYWISWTTPTQGQDLDQNQDQEQPSLAAAITFPLRSLTLKNVGFNPPELQEQCSFTSALKNLFSFTPRLKVLKLMSMNQTNVHQNDWSSILHHLQNLRITLNTIELSTSTQGHLSSHESKLIQEVCPLTSDWTLLANNVTPLSVQTLTMRSCPFVTTLELYWNPQSNSHSEPCCEGALKDAPRLLHEYLCSSSELAHLKTLKAPIRPEYMDIFNRGTVTNTNQPPTTTPPALPAIWACRGLETLHTELHGSYKPRTFFGYISRVLPYLEDLYISRPNVCRSASGGRIHASIDLQLKNGLCLLSRLRYLERLWIKPNRHRISIYFRITSMDLGWLDPSGDCSTSRWGRLIETKNWDTPRFMEGQKESTRPPHLRGLSPPEGASEKDKEIWEQLRYLGLFKDVEMMVNEMNTKGFVPLPALKKLSLVSLVPQRPKDELEAVFGIRNFI